VTPFAARASDIPDVANAAALIAMNHRVTQQATMLSYNNVFKLMFILSITCVPLVFLLRRSSATPGVVVVAE
jgi:hypothetical protein